METCLKQHQTYAGWFCAHNIGHIGICGCSPIKAFDKANLIHIANFLVKENERFFKALPISFFINPTTINAAMNAATKEL